MTHLVDGQKNLFRASALSNAGSTTELDLGVKVTRPHHWVVLAVTSVVVLAAVLLSILIEIPVKVASQGILITPAGIREVVSASAGRIDSILVAPGDFVTAGQEVAQVSQPDLDQEMRLAKAEQIKAQQELSKVLQFQRNSTSDFQTLSARKATELRRAQAFQSDRIDSLRQQIAGYEKLVREGFMPLNKLLSSKAELGAAEESAGKLQRELNELEYERENRRIQQEREVLSLELKIEDAGRKVGAAEERMSRRGLIVATESGVVVEQKLNAGEQVEVGRAIFAILPTSDPKFASGGRIPLVATLYVPAVDGKRIRPGMDAQVVPSTVKREEFGFIFGTVETVASVPSTPEGMMRSLKNKQLVDTLSKGGALFEVRVSIESSADTPSGFRWSSSAGPSSTLSAGSLCQADIVVRRQRVVSLLMPAVRRMLGEIAQ